MKLQEDLSPLLLLLFHCLVSVYTFITFLPACFLSWVSAPEAGSVYGSEGDRAKRAKAHSLLGRPEGPYRAVSSVKKLVTSLQPGLDTLDKMFEYTARRFPSRDCLGTREVISEEDERQGDGKVYKKVKRGEGNEQNADILAQLGLFNNHFRRHCLRETSPLIELPFYYISH